MALSYGCSGQLMSTSTNRGSIKAESGHSGLCMCVPVCLGTVEPWWQSKVVVNTLTCFSLDTCEDKHWFPWLTLTPCWVNTHPNSHNHSNVRQLLHTQMPTGTSAPSTAVWLKMIGPTNSASSGFIAASLQLSHKYSHWTTAHTSIMV